MAKNVGNISAQSASNPAAADEVKLCSKCGDNPRRKDGPWCDKCKTAQIREYRASAEFRAEARGFTRGAIAMRDAILAEFRKANPLGLLRAGEVAQFIAQLKTPDCVDEEVMVGEMAETV